MKKHWKWIVASIALAATAWATTYTSHYNLAKPADGSTSWGSNLRDNFDAIDAQMYSSANGLASHLADTVDAHDASAISAVAGSICSLASTVQEFLDCLDTEFNDLVGGNVVTIDTDQTITGAKTFSDVLTATGGASLSGSIQLPSLGDGLIKQTTGTLTSATLVDFDVSASAAITRSKLASGTASHVVINDGSGVMSSEAQLAASRGGTGQNMSASSGVVKVSSGTFSASALDLSSDTASTALPSSKGGTGADLSASTGLAHITAGAWSASSVALNSSDTSGFLPVNKGGTGAVTAASAINSISPMTTTGDTLYYDSANHQRLAGNTTTTKKYLSQTGNGSASAAPAWSQVATSDLTGTLGIANGGTGQTTASAAFNALSPNTTTGDITYYSGGTNTRLPVGSSNQYLKVSGGVPTWSTVNASSGNRLDNGGFESGTASWTASGGSFSTTTTAANVIEAATAGVWDSSASAQTLSYSAITAGGSAGTNGEFTCKIQTPSGTATHLLEVYDGSSVMVSATVSSSTNFTTNTVNFPWPSSATSVTARLKSVASNEPSINIDDCYLGPARNIGTVSQAQRYGRISYAGTTNCRWSKSGASYGSFSADTDCPTPTTSDFASAPATKIPGITFTSLPAGKYQVVVAGNFGIDGASGGYAFYRMTDGTNNSNMCSIYDGGKPASSGTCVFSMDYSSAQSSVTLQLQSYVSTGNSNIYNEDSFQTFEIQVYRYPSDSEQVYNPNTQNWKVDANISGANPSLGTSAITSYTGIENGSLSLTNNTGSGNLTAMIPCSSTNTATSTTCAAGNESVGVSFTLPAAGDVKACVSFTHYMNNSASATFEIVETPNSAQTISQEGKERLQSGHNLGTQDAFMPLRLCGTFTFASAGQKTLRLMYEMAAASATNHFVLGDQSTTEGQRDIHWEVYPITQNVPAPVLVGSVTSNSSGSERIERANITCSSGSTINNQSGSWITSIGNVSSGKCSIVIASGIFSSANYSCTFTPTGIATTAILGSQINNKTTTGIDLYGAVISTGSSTISAGTSFTGDLVCMGPR